MKLYDKDTNEELTTIKSHQLKDLVDLLEEEDEDDKDYYLTMETIAMLEEKGADTELVGKLRAVLGDREGMEIRWEEED